MAIRLKERDLGSKPLFVKNINIESEDISFDVDVGASFCEYEILDQDGEMIEQEAAWLVQKFAGQFDLVGKGITRNRFGVKDSNFRESTNRMVDTSEQEYFNTTELPEISVIICSHGPSH